MKRIFWYPCCINYFQEDIMRMPRFVNIYELHGIFTFLTCGLAIAMNLVNAFCTTFAYLPHQDFSGNLEMDSVADFKKLFEEYNPNKVGYPVSNTMRVAVGCHIN